MHINIGDIIFIKHYSDTRPIKSLVYDVKKDNITIKLTQDFATFDFFEGDPVVIGFESGREIYLSSCLLKSVDLRQCLINLSLNEIEKVTNKRKYERYPVSIYTNIKPKGTGGVNVGVLKNISPDGAMLCCKYDYPVEQEIEMELYMDSIPAFLHSSIVRKVDNSGHYEYGIEFIFNNPNSQECVNNYILRLQSEQQIFVDRLKQYV